MKRSAPVPRRRAGGATAWAWLPALAATTPPLSSGSERCAIRLLAPRILNDPARCRHSALSDTGAPTRREISPARRIGVGRIRSRTVPSARSISSGVTAGARAMSLAAVIGFKISRSGAERAIADRNQALGRRLRGPVGTSRRGRRRRLPGLAPVGDVLAGADLDRGGGRDREDRAEDPEQGAAEQ